MEIIKDFPPNIRDIAKRFDLTGFTPVFAYGDKLYNPTGAEIPDDLMVHEETHARQQKVLGVQDWWVKYLEDDGFRLKQELEAYGEQYKFVKDKYSRQVRRAGLQQMAKTLSSKLYGNIISKADAEYLIQNYE